MDFIPISQYNFIYYYVILIITLLVYINSNSNRLDSQTNKDNINATGIFTVIFLLIYMGLRPINSVFGDMTVYNLVYNSFQEGNLPTYQKDVLFEFLMYQFSKFSNSAFFFFTVSFFYIMCIYQVCKKLFAEYWFYAFLILISSVTFWAYGTNGLRNGLATSLFLWAICQDNKTTKILVLAMSFFIHQSLFLPIMAYVVSSYYKNDKMYFYFWLFAIPFSLILGKTIENFFISLGLGDKDMLTIYLADADESEGLEITVGFRWDFIVYSATAVYAAYYFIHKKQFKDAFYSQLVNIYLFANAVWILIIRANFSNRFSYLSWFMMGIIILYPMLKVKFFENQHQIIAKILLGYLFITLMLNIVFTKSGVVV